MKKNGIVLSLAFILYALMLIWLVIFKLDPQLSPSRTGSSLNLIPFAGSAMSNGRVDISEIAYNFLVFVPLGVYLSLFTLPKKAALRVAAGFAVSLMFETIQYAFCIGASDITDIIMNTAGTAFGVFSMEILSEKRREKLCPIITWTLLLLEAAVASLIIFIIFVQ